MKISSIPLENRARFALRVYEEMRSRVSEGFLLGIRLSIDDDNPEGLSAAEAVEFARILEREGAVDFFNANFGRMDTLLGLAEHVGNQYAANGQHDGPRNARNQENEVDLAALDHRVDNIPAPLLRTGAAGQH